MTGGPSLRLLSPWLTIRVQLGLAAVFIVAALAKIADPPGFAHEISNYKLLPASAVNPFALILPWLELVLGVCFFLGNFRRTAGRLAAMLLVVFIARCRSTSPAAPVDWVLQHLRKDQDRGGTLGDMKLAILRDVFFLAMTQLSARRDDRAQKSECGPPAAAREARVTAELRSALPLRGHWWPARSAGTD